MTSNSNFPYVIEDHNVGETMKHLQDLVTVGPKKYVLPKAYRQLKDLYYNFEVRPTDVVIAGYPRSGTTLTQELVWLICNDLDFKTAKEHNVEDRVPFLDWQLLLSRKTKIEDAISQAEDMFKNLKNTRQKRFIKTHIPFSLLPPNLLETGCKVVYVARNPKDVFTSQYHFFQLRHLENYQVDFKEYFDEWRSSKLVYMPYFEGLKEAWNLRNNPNFIFIFYEDLIKNKDRTIRRLGEFFGKELSTRDVENLMDHTNISNFKNNNAVNNIRLKTYGLTVDNKEHNFIRKGKIGDWLNYADKDLDEEANEWIKENLEGIKLRFPC